MCFREEQQFLKWSTVGKFESVMTNRGAISKMVLGFRVGIFRNFLFLFSIAYGTELEFVCGKKKKDFGVAFATRLFQDQARPDALGSSGHGCSPTTLGGDGGACERHGWARREEWTEPPNEEAPTPTSLARQSRRTARCRRARGGQLDGTGR